MNTQLVDSIIKVIRALPQAERQMLIDQLNRMVEYDIDSINEDAWEVWQSLGDDVVAGRLENTSIHHDNYLYSQEQ
jgi:hypothetical protein